VETWVDEGLQEHQPMAKALLPIAGQPAVAQRQDLGAQITMMPVGQNQKTAIVGDQLEPVIIILDGENPSRSTDPALRISTRPPKNSTTPPTARDRWPRTTGCDRSWADTPGNDAPPSVGDEAALRCA